MSLVRDVTADNYAEKGHAFIGQHSESETAGFLIVRRLRRKNNANLAPTLKQWGAWRSYFVGKGIATTWFDTRDYYTVPAEWPHLFDAQATLAADTEAGWAFEATANRRQARTPRPPEDPDT